MHSAPRHGSWLGQTSHGNCALLCRDWCFPGYLSGKESTCQCRRLRDTGSIPGSRRSPGEGNGNHSHILAWEIPWTKVPGGLQSKGLQRVGHDLVTKKYSILLHVVYTKHLLYPFICLWVLGFFSMSWVLYIVLLWILGYMYVFK